MQRSAFYSGLDYRAVQTKVRPLLEVADAWATSYGEPEAEEGGWSWLASNCGTMFTEGYLMERLSCRRLEGRPADWSKLLECRRLGEDTLGCFRYCLLVEGRGLEISCVDGN